MTKMWKVAYGHGSPIEVVAKKPCWPNLDSDGTTIFENTHFTDEEKAWEQHEREHRAGLSLAADRLKHAKEEVALREKQAADAAVFLADVWSARRTKQQDQKGFEPR